MVAPVQGMTGRRILIVGGGCAGITTAATLKKHDSSLEIAILEPSDLHWYQPGFTLVGAGIFTRAQTERREETLIPKGVRWIKKAAAEFLPDQNAVRLQDNSLEHYDFLIACPGLKLAWEKIEGLTESLGRNGVCSNYLPQVRAVHVGLDQGVSRRHCAIHPAADADQMRRRSAEDHVLDG